MMVLSFPHMTHLPWISKKNPKAQYPTVFVMLIVQRINNSLGQDPVEPWCFTHWPGADCFITHHCASRKQKAKLIERYDWWKDDPEQHFRLDSIIYLHSS